MALSKQQMRDAQSFALDRPLYEYPMLSTANSDVPVLTKSRPWSFKVDRLDALARVVLRFQATVTTGATPGTPTARTRNPVEALGDISVSINGNPEIVANPDLLFCLAQIYREGEPLEISPLTNAQLAAASTTPSGTIEVPLDFVVPTFAPAQAGLVPAGADSIKSITVSGTAGTAASLMNSAGATQDISAFSLFPFIERHKVSGLSRRGYGAILRKQGEIAVPSTGRTTIQLDAGQDYVGIALRAVTGTTSDPSDSVLTSGQLIQVKSEGLPVYEDYPERLAFQTSKMLPVNFTRTGFYYIDLTSRRQNASALRNMSAAIPSGGKELELSVHLTAGTSTRLQYVPVIKQNVGPTAEGRKISAVDEG